MTDGVFYGAETPHTAIAEIAFYRLLFFAESPDTPWPTHPAEYTAFSVEYKTKKAIDLTRGKYANTGAHWTHPTDISHCQAFADVAREAKIEVIRYESVREPAHGINLALLSCRAFASQQPIEQQTWHIRLSQAGAQAICEAPKRGMTFDHKAFAADPRIIKLRWDRR